LDAPSDVVITGGVVERVAPQGAAKAGRHTVLELPGYVVLAALAEPHTHLDKALTADRVANPRGDLPGAIDKWMAVGPRERYHDLEERALRVLADGLAAGVTAFRTHVDTGAATGLDPLERLLAVKKAVAPWVDLQVFPSFGLPVTGRDGLSQRRLIERAIEAGADGIGGAPNFDPAPGEALAIILDTAAQGGVPLDLHLDETLDPAHFLLEDVAERAGALGVPVTVDHVCSLALQPPERIAATAAKLAQARVNVVTLPLTNLYLQGREAASPVQRGITAVRDLLDAGVNVAGGADNLLDAFNLVGRPDPLETAALLVAGAHLTIAEALHAVTQAARSTLGLGPAGPAPGAAADLLVARARSPQELVAFAPPERLVFKGGSLVARTETQREPVPWAGADGIGHLACKTPTPTQVTT
jgi:cytosine deaminase